MRSFNALLVRDLKLAARVGGSGVMGLIFFLMIVTLMPFALGPDLNLLSRIGPAILWIAALLATLIGLDRLFQADQEDGSLDLLRLVARAAGDRGAGEGVGPLARDRPAARPRGAVPRPARGAVAGGHARHGGDPAGRHARRSPSSARSGRRSPRRCGAAG